MEKNFFDDIGRLIGGAMGNFTAFREESERFVHTQIQKFFQKHDMVSREEFDTVKAMLEKARKEQNELIRRVEHLEQQVAPSRAEKEVA